MSDIEITEEAQILLRVSKYVKQQFKTRMDEYGKDKDVTKGLRATMLHVISMNDEQLDEMFELSKSLMLFYALWDRKKVDSRISPNLPKGVEIKVAPDGPFSNFIGEGTGRVFNKLDAFFDRMSKEMDKEEKLEG